MNFQSRAGAALLALVFMASSVPAPAADPSSAESVAQAIVRFKRGQELYAERNYSAALIEFKKAYELAPNYRVLYNIGQVCFQVQDYVCALQSFERYLSSGGAEIADQRRQDVQKELAGLQQRVGFLELQSNVDGAEVSVDDALMGTTPLTGPIALSVGRRRIAVVKSGYTPFSRTVDIGGQDTARLQAKLDALAVAAPSAVVPSATVSIPPRPIVPVAPVSQGKMTTLSWVGFGLGGAMVVGGVVTGVLSLGAASDVRNKVYADESSASSDKSKVSTLAGVTDGLLIGGLLTVAATGLLTFVISSGPSSNVQVGVSPTGVSTRIVF
jgi:hypothetical protein